MSDTNNLGLSINAVDLSHSEKPLFKLYKNAITFENVTIRDAYDRFKTGNITIPINQISKIQIDIPAHDDHVLHSLRHMEFTTGTDRHSFTTSSTHALLTAIEQIKTGDIK